MSRILIPLLTLLALAGCGSSSSSTSGSSTSSSSSATSSSSAAQPAAAAATGTTVAMKNFAFTPATITAKVGQTLHFTNQDTAPHNVVGVSGPKFASSPTLAPGGKFSLKLTRPGTIRYICSIHPFMKATIVVTR